MEELAEGVWQLTGFPRHAVNQYLVGDVLIDGGTRWARWRISRLLKGRKLSGLALTHCHPDHQGVIAALCKLHGAPLACHEADAPIMEGRVPFEPNHWIMRAGRILMAGPARSVDRVLHDGDLLGEFRVVHTPGHTPGHVVYFRERDRVAIAGDLMANINFRTWQTGLRLPPRQLSWDAALNRQSIEKLLALAPKVVVFGHGPPLREPELLSRFVERMKAYYQNRESITQRT